MQTAGGYMETTFGECTDNEKKETVISDCSEMRTEATSRPSVGLVAPQRRSSPGFYSWGHDSYGPKSFALAMTCLVLPQIHQENQFRVRPKPGNIYFSLSLIVRTEA